MADMTLSADINADVSGFTSGISKAESSTESFKAKCQSVGSSAQGAGDKVRDAGDDVGSFSSKCKGAGSGASGLATKFSTLRVAAGNLAADLAGRAIDAVMSLGGEMVAASDSADKFRSTLDFAGIDSGTIDSLVQSTQAYADQTVYDLADIRNATAQLAANGVDNYAQLAEAAGNLNAVAGGNADTFKSVSMVMSQTAGSGKLMTENWQQLTDAIPGASGALQDAMREAGAFEGNFREAMENGEISADEFFAAVQKLGMTDVAREAATSTSTIEGAVGNLQAAFVGVGSQVVDAFKPFVTGAMSELAGFVSSVPSLLAPLGTAIQTALSGGGTTDFGAVLGQMTTGLITGLTTAVQNLAAQLPTIMQTVVPLALQAVSTLLQSILRQVPALLMSLVGLVVSGVSSFVSAISAQLPTMLPQIVGAALSFLNQLVTSVLTDLPTYLGQMVDAAVALFTGIADSIPQVIPVVVEGIGNLVRNVLDNLPTFLSQMMAAAVELFNGIVQAIPQVVPAVLQGIADLLSQVWDAITSFDLVGAGQQLIQGFINGISSMAGAVWDAVGSIASGAIDTVKGWLGIASPSKVFREIGDYTMQGMALGIGAGARDAISAMDRAVRSVSREASAGLVSVPARLDVAGTAASVALGGAVAAGRYATSDSAIEPVQERPQAGRTVYQTVNNRIVRTNDDLYVAATIMSRSNLSAAMGV